MTSTPDAINRAYRDGMITETEYRDMLRGDDRADDAQFRARHILAIKELESGVDTWAASPEAIARVKRLLMARLFTRLSA